MNDFLGLLKRLGIRRKYVFLLILRAPFDALRTCMLACLMKTTFLCLETGESDKLVVQCLLYGLICALLFFYNGTIWSIYAAFAAKTEAQLQKMLLNKMTKMSFRRVSTRFGGEWITKVNSDIHTAFILMNGPLNIPHAVVSIFNIMLSSFLLFKSSLLLLVAVWVFLIPHMYINYKLVLKHMPELKEMSQSALAENTSAITPLITDAESILIYDAGDLMMKHCETSSRKLMKINLNMHMRNALGGRLIRSFGISGYLVIMFLGYDKIYYGGMSFPELVYAFQLRVSILAAMLMLTTCVSNIRANSICVKRVNDTFEE